MNKPISFVMHAAMTLIFIGAVVRDVPALIVLGFFISLSIFVLLTIRKEGISLSNHPACTWLYVVGVFGVFTLIPQAFHLPWGELFQSNFIRYFWGMVIILVVCFTLIRIDVDEGFFWRQLLLVSVIIAFALFSEARSIGWDKAIGGEHRFGYFVVANPIDFGIYANVIFIMLPGALYWAYKQRSMVLTSLVILALVVTFLATVASHSRTAWIGWPEAVLGWGLFFGYLWLKSSKRLFWGVVFVTLMTLFIALVTQVDAVHKPLEHRAVKALKNIENYMSGNPKTSLGYRFVMYESSLSLFQESPWVGIGYDQFPHKFGQETKRVLENRSKSQWKEGLSYSHVHNQFLMHLVTGGLIALAALVLLVLMPLVFSIKALKVLGEGKAIAMAGTVASSALLLGMLPESPLQFMGTYVYYFLIYSLLIVVMSSLLRQQTGCSCRLDS